MTDAILIPYINQVAVYTAINSRVMEGCKVANKAVHYATYNLYFVIS